MLVFGRIALVVLTVACSIGVVHAETASRSEMERVALNWVTLSVRQFGLWGETSAPSLELVGTIAVGDTMLAGVYGFAPRGFVIVPALKALPPIIAYSDECSFDFQEQDGLMAIVRNDLLNRLPQSMVGRSLNDTNQAARAYTESQSRLWARLTADTAAFRRELMTSASASILGSDPLLTSSWNQDAPFNDSCPSLGGQRCWAGCTAIAFAQVMNYWRWPISGVGSHAYFWSVGRDTLRANFEHKYRWGNMVPTCDLGCTSAQRSSIAQLVSDVGIAFEMDYDTSGSTASFAPARILLAEHFGYRDSIGFTSRRDHSADSWYQAIQAEIDAGRPIPYIIGWSSSGNDATHAVVCDGWRYRESLKEYHLNYGWGGSRTFWYILDEWYAPSERSGRYEQMYVRIQPNREPYVQLRDVTIADEVLGDGDGRLEAGETAMVFLSLQNAGAELRGSSIRMLGTDSVLRVVDSVSAFCHDLPSGQAKSVGPFLVAVDSNQVRAGVYALPVIITSPSGYMAVDTCMILVGDSAGFLDSLHPPSRGWKHQSVTPHWIDGWHLDSSRYHTPPMSWKVGGMGTGSYLDFTDAGLTTPPLLLPTSARLSFWHWIDAELDTTSESKAWDGGIVEISSGGDSWRHLTPIGGYPFEITDSCDGPFAIGSGCFSGRTDWSKVEFDLSNFTGVVRLRFRFGADTWYVGEGWYIDDIEVSSYIAPGDMNHDGEVDFTDLVTLVDDVLVRTDARDQSLRSEADLNCDCVVDIRDISEMITFLFGESPKARIGCIDIGPEDPCVGMGDTL